MGSSWDYYDECEAKEADKQREREKSIKEWNKIKEVAEIRSKIFYNMVKRRTEPEPVSRNIIIFKR